MILGRNPALILAVVAALLNVLVGVFGVPLSIGQLAAVNGLAIALVGVIANETDPTTVSSLAFTRTPPDLTAPGAAAPAVAAGPLDPASAAGLAILRHELASAPQTVAALPSAIPSVPMPQIDVPPVSVAPTSAWGEQNNLPGV